MGKAASWDSSSWTSPHLSLEAAPDAQQCNHNNVVGQTPVEAYPEAECLWLLRYAGNVWEWTAVFQGYEGFVSYPTLVIPRFDGQHRVLKGRWATRPGAASSFATGIIDIHQILAGFPLC